MSTPSIGNISVYIIVGGHLMQTDSFAGVFDQNANQWARQEPLILSDFTARPLVLQELAPVTGKHVLDLGCGEGYVARLVAQAGAQSVFGIDISSEMVGRAQQAASGAPCPMTFKIGNATNFQDFPRKQFDRVIAVFMVSYLSRADMTAVFRTVAGSNPRQNSSWHSRHTVLGDPKHWMDSDALPS